MQVSEIMTPNVTYVTTDTPLNVAARRMAELDTGFLPIADQDEQRLQGVVTDRDIVIRGVAEDRDASSTTVDEVKTDRVLYCFEGDTIDRAAESMREQQVYRLVVLDTPESKRLTGVLSLGDISRQGREALAGVTASEITSN